MSWPNEVKNQAESLADDEQAELHQWYYHMRYVTIEKLLLLAKLGKIQKASFQDQATNMCMM